MRKGRLSNHPYSKMADAIDKGQVLIFQKLLAEHPEMREFRVPGASGTWLHYVARWASLDFIKMLIHLGYDINSTEQREEKRPVTMACYRGDPEIVRFFLDQGASLDTSWSSVNPLFAAVRGKSVEVTQMLLDAGIDAAVVYGEPWDGDGMTALGWARMWGEMEIARAIASHLADGDEAKIEELMAEGLRLAKANTSPISEDDYPH